MRLGDSGWRTLSRAAVLAAGAGLFTAPFLARLASVNERWWITRDDGVITLSHARNLVDFGSIGVSPGGDRVEGFSSPLHLATSALVQLGPGTTDARTISMLILAASLVTAGVCLTVGFGVLVRAVLPRLAPIGHDVATLAAVAVAAAATAVPWTTTGWLGSGMENPLILASMAAIIGGALAAFATRAATAMAVVGLCCLVVARVEFAAFALPVIVAAAGAGIGGHTDGRIRRAAFVAGVPLACALVVHLARRWYFGAWLPNTAVVQDRQTGLVQLVAIAAIGLVLIVPMVWRLAASTLADADLRHALDVAAKLATATLGVTVFWLGATGRLGGSLDSVVLLPGLLAFVAVIGVARAAQSIVSGTASRGSASVDRDLVFVSLAALPVGQFLVTGPARLDDYRVLGLVVPVLVVWAVVALIELCGAVLATPRESFVGPIVRLAAFPLVCAVAVGGVVWTAGTDRAWALQYEIIWADRIVEIAADMRAADLIDRGMVITANPDLGKLSFAKQSVIVDLGLLGDPLMATLRTEREDLVDRYLTHVAVPDIVESHSGWSCLYRGWLESPEFVGEYELIGAPDADWRRPPAVCPLDGDLGIWMRVVDNGEYDLTVEILQAVDPAAIIAGALSDCVGAAGGGTRCQHVRRSVQRAAHELRDRGTFGDVVAEFESSPSADFDRAMLDRGPNWWTEAFEGLVPLLEQLD